MKRREFIQSGSLAASLLTSSSLANDVKFLGLATNWGWQGTLDEFAKKVKSLGYDGFEMWYPLEIEKRTELLKVLEKYALRVGFLVGGQGPDFTKHFDVFSLALKGAISFSAKPLYVNCHSGKDYFSFEQNSKFIELGINESERTGIKVAHETHRGRMCFAANVTQRFLEKYPKMKLTLDISHWTNVHESMLDDQKEAVEAALDRVVHIHTRVGHQEGPQVSDPRAPEWAFAFNQHMKWWDTAIKNQMSKGDKTITFLTEFGPPSYLPTLPYTNMPVADQWDINVYMLKLLKEKYK